MPAIVLTLLQGLLLLLLYVFIGRAVRAVVRDVRAPAPVTRSARPQRAATSSDRRSSERKRVPPSQLVVHAREGRPQVIDLGGPAIVFGRAGNATVTLTDPYISDQHAKVYREGTDWLVTDLQSTNGTFVNQVKVTGPTPLTAGDQLGIGRTVVEVRK